jgi:hypothetical protein
MGVCLEELYPKLPNGVFFFIFFFSFLFFSLKKKKKFIQINIKEISLEIQYFS